MSDSVFQLQSDVYARLMSDAYFEDINVLLNEKGLLADDIENALKVITEKSGKLGACVVVDRPGREVPKPDPSGPEFNLVLPVVAFEFPLLNRDIDGTGKTIEEITSQVMHLLHGWRTQPSLGQIYCDTPAATPTVGDDGIIACELVFRTRMRFDAPTRVATPLITGNASAVQITCNTPSAEIYYTTNGTTPWSGNATATLHDGNAFAVPSGTTIRAAAFKTNYQASDIAAQTF